MPAQVAQFAAVSGRQLQYRAVLYAGFNLEDHWNLGVARAALAGGGWDVVVMQEGPPYLPEDQEHLRIWVARWADLAREAGTRPALLTVWPDRDRRSAMPDIIASQQRTAQAARAQLLPGRGGLAGRLALRPASVALRPRRCPREPSRHLRACPRRVRRPLRGACAFSSSLSPGSDVAYRPAPASRGCNSARSPASSGQPLRLTPTTLDAACFPRTSVAGSAMRSTVLGSTMIEHARRPSL